MINTQRTMIQLRRIAAIALAAAIGLLGDALLAAPAPQSASPPDGSAASTNAGQDDKTTPARAADRAPAANNSTTPATSGSRATANRAPSPEIFFPSEEIPTDRPISLPADI